MFYLVPVLRWVYYRKWKMEKRKVCVYDDWDVVETENVMFNMFGLWNLCHLERRNKWHKSNITDGTNDIVAIDTCTVHHPRARTHILDTYTHACKYVCIGFLVKERENSKNSTKILEWSMTWSPMAPFSHNSIIFMTCSTSVRCGYFFAFGLNDKYALIIIFFLLINLNYPT